MGCLVSLVSAGVFLLGLSNLFSGAVGPGFGYLIVSVIVWAVGQFVVTWFSEL